ncbi:TPA: DUF2829 domain-containing protein [Salmonella enterica]|nr:DUF2829 domain-containing protein [Salmonella enterica]
MEKFIGVKLINAAPMTRQAYNDFRGWVLPADENGDDEGYLVEYIDGGKPNTDHYAGYVSWSPKDVFEKAYRMTTGMNFGLAIEALKQGKKVARSGWNGKGMWLAYVKPYTEAVHSGDSPCFCSRVFELPEGAHGDPARAPQQLPYIAMKTADNKLVPWLASQTDVLADDWTLVN